ncbi:MAG TPA: RES family NAD+ phosphorylase, partial [Acidobacteriota bacterium]|nr:RES family NAD+ phosphorylase [Acidobacteriota bacterium]
AALEFLVHVDGAELPADLIHVEIDVPDDVRIDRIERAQLPRNWRKYPAPERLQQLGGDWLSGLATAVLQVPSAVIPEECNYLLNPLHVDATRFAFVRSADFIYDPRLAE